jgi:hypothetical protein
MPHASCLPRHPRPAPPQAKRKRERMGDMRIVVAGCVAQQEGQALLRRVPEVDLVMGESSTLRRKEFNPCPVMTVNGGCAHQEAGESRCGLGPAWLPGECAAGWRPPLSLTC